LLLLLQLLLLLPQIAAAMLMMWQRWLEPEDREKLKTLSLQSA
jgi:hypothetical protein